MLTGLPALFPKLVEERTFAERMFHVTMLGRLNNAESRDAILKPIQQQGCPVRFSEAAAAELPNCDVEFTVQEIVEQSQKPAKPFSASHVNQILGKLMENGMVYKNRHGRYSFAVPLLGDFIRRQEAEA